MLVLHTRANEKIVLPNAETSIEVVAIQSGSVRLAIRGPENVQVLREPQAEWAPDAQSDEAPSLPKIRQLLEKRLEIAREGLTEAHAMMRAGNSEDAQLLIEKIDEDLHLLRRRLRREFERAETLSCGI
jgi:carbon storage regulator CsrA